MAQPPAPPLASPRMTSPHFAARAPTESSVSSRFSWQHFRSEQSTLFAWREREGLKCFRENWSYLFLARSQRGDSGMRNQRNTFGQQFNRYIQNEMTNQQNLKMPTWIKVTAEPMSWRFDQLGVNIAITVSRDMPEENLKIWSYVLRQTKPSHFLINLEWLQIVWKEIYWDLYNLSPIYLSSVSLSRKYMLSRSEIEIVLASS